MEKDDVKESLCVEAGENEEDGQDANRKTSSTPTSKHPTPGAPATPSEEPREPKTAQSALHGSCVLLLLKQKQQGLSGRSCRRVTCESPNIRSASFTDPRFLGNNMLEHPQSLTLSTIISVIHYN